MTPARQDQPATIAPPPAPGVAGTGEVTYTITIPRTQQDIEALRERRSELSDQLVSAAARRTQIAEELKVADGAVRSGLEQRMAVLDKRILQLESDIAETGQQLTSAPAGLIAASGTPLTEFIQPHMVEKVSIMFTLFVLAPIALSVAWAIFRRTMKPSRQTSEVPDGGERLRRLENSVDAIAVEIERISEGQRFVTRLLTEQAPDLALGSRQGQSARLGSRSEE